MRKSLMRTTIAVCGSLVVSSVLAGPQLEIAEPTFQFGERERGEIVEHTFVLKNTGDEPLSITHVQAACGCTSTQLTGTEISAGSETRLEVKLSLKSQSGPQNRKIAIETNDSVHPKTIVSLVGVAHSRVTVDPPTMTLKATVDSSGASGMVAVKGTEGLTFDITKIETSDAKIVATTTTLKVGETYQVYVKVEPPLEEGLLKGWIRLRTNQEGEYSTIVIPVSATISGDLTILPRKLELKAGASCPTQQTLSIGPGKIQKFKITSVEMPSSSMTAATEEISDGYRVVLSNIQVSDQLDGKEVKIKTDIDGGKVITVPIRVCKGANSCHSQSSRVNNTGPVGKSTGSTEKR